MVGDSSSDPQLGAMVRDEICGCEDAAGWCRNWVSKQLPCSVHGREMFDFGIPGGDESGGWTADVNRVLNVDVRCVQYSTNSYLRQAQY